MPIINEPDKAPDSAPGSDPVEAVPHGIAEDTKPLATPSPEPPAAEAPPQDEDQVMGIKPEQLAVVSPQDLIYAYKDILYRLHHVHEGLRLLGQKQVTVEPEKAQVLKARNTAAAAKLKAMATAVAGEMKRREIDHTKISVEPEQKCDFVNACLAKLKAINEESKGMAMLPCHYCEYNTVRSPLPNPTTRFIVIDRMDIMRHYRQLKIPMKIKKWEATLMAMNVLEEGKYFVLNMKDQLCLETVMEHMSKLARIQKERQLDQMIRKTMQPQPEVILNGQSPATDFPAPKLHIVEHEAGVTTAQPTAGSPPAESPASGGPGPDGETVGEQAAEGTPAVGEGSSASA